MMGAHPDRPCRPPGRRAQPSSARPRAGAPHGRIFTCRGHAIAGALRMRSRRHFRASRTPTGFRYAPGCGDAGQVGREPGRRGRSSRASFRTSTRSSSSPSLRSSARSSSRIRSQRIGSAPADRSTSSWTCAARAALPPVEGELASHQASSRHGRGPAGRVGDPLPVRLVAGRPVVRARVRAGVGRLVPDRARVARGRRAPLGMVLGLRSRPTSSPGAVGFHRDRVREAGRWAGIAVDDAASSRSRREGARVGRAMPARRSSTRCSGWPPSSPSRGAGRRRSSFHLARGLSMQTLGRQALRLGCRAVRRRDREAASAPAVDPPSSRRARSRGSCWTGSAFARAWGSNSWVVSGSRTASSAPAAGQRVRTCSCSNRRFELHLRAPRYEARGVAPALRPGHPRQDDAAPRVGPGGRRERRHPGPRAP